MPTAPFLKRLYLHKALFVGVAAALLVGTAAATFASSAGERVDDSPLVVPVGRVGDRVVYSYFATSTDAEHDWSRHGPQMVGAVVLTEKPEATKQPPSELQARGPRVFKLETTAPMRDASLVAHDSVIVVRNETLPDLAGFAYQVAESVDLDQRQVFRIDENALLEKGDPVSVAGSVSGTVQSTQFVLREPSLPGLAHQGARLKLGVTLRDRDVAPPPDLEGTVTQAHEREWVSDRARINGVDAYAVRYEVTYKAIVPASVVDDSSAGASTEATEPSAADGGSTAEVQVRAWRVDWMSAQHAYAVLRQTGLEFLNDGTWSEVESHRTVYVFQSVDAGSAFLRWQPHLAAHWNAESSVERTAGAQFHPADGAGSTLEYPLEHAVASVEADATLIEFRLWKQTHASARLVGARYSALGGTAQWELLFATPSGQGHIVVTERETGKTSANNRIVGAKNAVPYNLSDFPANPPTLAGLERAWSETLSPAAASERFNYVVWGFDTSEDGGRACGGVGGQVKAQVPSEGGSPPRRLLGGHRDAASGFCAGGPAGGTTWSEVGLDAANGRVLGATESTFRYDFAGQNIPFTDLMKQRWTQNRSTVPTGLAPPEPAEAAGASAGSLAAFLALYFWPTLKFLLFKGGLAVAGYAKIAREDLLNNPMRDAILQLIRSVPGIHASDIARQVQGGWGTIVYHLSVLERNKVVTSLVDGRHKRFFPADTVDYSKRGQIAALRNPTTKTIYEIIETSPGIVQGDMASRTGLTIPTVIWHLQRLESAGLVGRDKEGRKFHYFANPAYEPKATGPESVEVQ